MPAGTRREMLKTMGAVAVGGLVAAMGPPATQAQKLTKPFTSIRFGVQLNAFPIDPENFDTFIETLETIKGIGYQGFESSFLNVRKQFPRAVEARRRIESTGLTFFGIHIFLATELYDVRTAIAPAALYEEVARGGAALGAKYVVLSGAPVASADQLNRKIEALNRAGEFVRRAGLGVAYHNHWPEFESKLGEIDALYTRTDPALVSFVLDAGHAYRGGANVPAFIRTHKARIVAFHFRDYKNGKLISLGGGTFPLQQVADTIRQVGWRGWVENEEEREDLSKTGAQVIEPAYKAMKEAFSS